jgi:hypothetical protein
MSHRNANTAFPVAGRASIGCIGAVGSTAASMPGIAETEYRLAMCAAAVLARFAR